eukprot:CAMPEP_0198142974 /NCGR_PEP_ID=MMETSP1443-20131203/5616_1 /TAXON_ID=186043 /ORGANISM="Entomoneis sp., Strain CCMP2396" /LENGTH=628 /DNA_ID=CAMNT_0043806109 /DNA_START=185 /DNA_END=2071 /DNA_ORIENTATION=-
MRPSEASASKKSILMSSSSKIDAGVVPAVALSSWMIDSGINSDAEATDLLGRPGNSKFWAKPVMDTKAFNFLLLKLAKSDRRDKGNKAARVLRYMLDESVDRPEVKPDNLTLNTVLSAVSKSMNPTSKSSMVADKIFHEWKELFRERKVEKNVDIITYNTMISAHIRAGNLKRAEEVFSELLTENGDSVDLKPDFVSYATIMRGYASRGDVAKVEALFQFQRMQEGGQVKPTVESYNELLYAYSRADMPSRAEECLKLWLKESSHLTVQPDVRSYNIVLHALSKTGSDGSIVRTERIFNKMSTRDAVSYTTMISAYCRHLSARAALAACERVMEKCWKDRDCTIDTNLVSNVLYSVSLIEHKEMPTFAEGIVTNSTQRSVKLNIKAYNSLLYCWAKSGDYEAARRARQILTMVEKNPRLKPNLQTYTTVLDCFARSREHISLDFAKNITERMEKNGPEPNVHVYTTLIQNYARSNLPYKALEASKVLQRMKDSKSPEAQPNIVSYNCVLNAAEHSDPTGGVVTEEALKVACLTFDEIRTSPVKANHVTYGTFLGVLGKLMPASSRQEIVGLVFRRASQEGQVSPLVLRKLQQATDSREQYLSILGNYEEASIPASWNLNVREVRARDL